MLPTNPSAILWKCLLRLIHTHKYDICSHIYWVAIIHIVVHSVHVPVCMDVPKYVSGSGLQGKRANCTACLCIMVKLLEGKMWGDHQFCQRQVGETWGYLHWVKLGNWTRGRFAVRLNFLENESPPPDVTISCCPGFLESLLIRRLITS